MRPCAGFFGGGADYEVVEPAEFRRMILEELEWIAEKY